MINCRKSLIFSTLAIRYNTHTYVCMYVHVHVSLQRQRVLQLSCIFDLLRQFKPLLTPIIRQKTPKCLRF